VRICVFFIFSKISVFKYLFIFGKYLFFDRLKTKLRRFSWLFRIVVREARQDQRQHGAVVKIRSSGSENISALHAAPLARRQDGAQIRAPGPLGGPFLHSFCECHNFSIRPQNSLKIA